jgi:hypothetical protein
VTAASVSEVRTRRGTFAVVASAALLGFVLLPATASGYVRYRSESGCPYTWQTRTIPITGFPQGLPNDVALDDIVTAMSGAVSAWGKTDPALIACTDLDLQLTVLALSVTPPSAAKYDHQNSIMFRDTWGCMPGPNGYPECRDPNALAITSVFATKWGQIVDADIEVNAVTFTWANLDTTPPGGGKQDIQNALTHEMGHFIGLDHTCYGDPTRVRPNDQNGQPIPECGDVTPGDPVYATTMFASAVPGDVSKRSLEPDDQQAVCDIYPAGAQDFLACPVPDQGGGCGIGNVGNVARLGSVSAPRADDISLTGWRSWVGAGTMLLSLAAIAGARRARRRPRS